MTPGLMVPVTILYAAGLAAAAYFTRATARRFFAACCGGLSVAILGVPIEIAAHALGWWRYPGVETPYGPAGMYPAIALAWSALALIGWRATRRAGWRGELAFLGAVAVLGTIRDYRIAAVFPDLIVFRPGVAMVFIDALCWSGTVALAQAVMTSVAGPSRADPLARRRRDTLPDPPGPTDNLS